MAQRIVDVHVRNTVPLPTPRELEAELPMSDEVRASVVRGRQAIEDILDGRDSRLLVITGPCSIHDEQAALEYAERLARLNEELGDRVCIAMRVYFEKPRTTVGWKGMIYDPDLDGSFNIASRPAPGAPVADRPSAGPRPADGARSSWTRSRRSTSADLISWVAVGARTTESQTHRQMASGLSHAGRLQEQHRRQHRGRRQRAALGARAARLPRYRPRGPDLHGADQRQPATATSCCAAAADGPNYDSDHRARRVPTGSSRAPI